MVQFMNVVGKGLSFPLHTLTRICITFKFYTRVPFLLGESVNYALVR